MSTFERTAGFYRGDECVSRDLKELDEVTKRLGVQVVRRDANGVWRPVYRHQGERERRLTKIEAEIRGTLDSVAAIREAHSRNIELDLTVSELRAERRKRRPPARG